MKIPLSFSCSHLLSGICLKLYNSLAETKTVSRDSKTPVQSQSIFVKLTRQNAKEFCGAIIDKSEDIVGTKKSLRPLNCENISGMKLKHTAGAHCTEQ